MNRRGHQWPKSYTVFGIIVFVLAIIGISMIGINKKWFSLERDNLPQRATINNILLQIDTNIYRLQVTMEDLVYAAYPAVLAGYINNIFGFEASIYKDFKELEEHVGSDNLQYKKAYAEFLQWRITRAEIINLTAKGPSIKAKELVRGACATQALTIRENLMKLGDNGQ